MNRGSDDNGETRPTGDPLDSLRLHLAEFKEYAGYLSGLKLAQVRHTLQKAGLLISLGGACAVLTLVAGAMSVILILMGLSHWLGRATGEAWIGELLVGGAVLLTLVVGAAGAAARMRAAWRKNTVREFEARQERQRVRFNRDVEEAAREQVRRSVPQHTGGKGPARAPSDGHGYQG